MKCDAVAMAARITPVTVSLAALYDHLKMRAALKPEAIWEIERGRALSLALAQAWHGA